MSSPASGALAPPPPVLVDSPTQQTAPVVFASPHSGSAYPPEFVAESRLDAVTLRRSEDAFVDRLFAGVPAHGAPLIRALFPRAYIDPNREPYELDPDMFDGDLPAYVNVRSPRAAVGLGTIARVVASGAEIYRHRLPFAKARERVEQCYRPYHEALAGLLDRTAARFGGAWLIDCHSMPSVGGPMDRDPGRRRVDFVLGDCHGTSCAPALMARVETHLAARGFSVARNDPYAGGFCTQHYGRPAQGRHALQIEINRALYMDEVRIEPRAGFGVLQQEMDRLAGLATTVAPEELAAR